MAVGSCLRCLFGAVFLSQPQACRRLICAQQGSLCEGHRHRGSSAQKLCRSTLCVCIACSECVLLPCSSLCCCAGTCALSVGLAARLLFCVSCHVCQRYGRCVLYSLPRPCSSDWTRECERVGLFGRVAASKHPSSLLAVKCWRPAGTGGVFLRALPFLGVCWVHLCMRITCREEQTMLQLVLA